MTVRMNGSTTSEATLVDVKTSHVGPSILFMLFHAFSCFFMLSILEQSLWERLERRFVLCGRSRSVRIESIGWQVGRPTVQSPASGRSGVKT
jgi:hypothetical protein